MQVWDVVTGAKQYTFEGHNSQSTCVFCMHEENIQLVPPAYYAHLAAFRSHFYMELDNSDSVSLSSGAATGHGAGNGVCPIRAQGGTSEAKGKVFDVEVDAKEKDKPKEDGKLKLCIDGAIKIHIKGSASDVTEFVKKLTM
ncbi:hypothetical protein IFM89_027896 [Coptis chinensis]|uniref:Uncharacterized protein n=1 Tax=Coptis chinensis TaxID=261450 RepID=A0A835LK08_9MAGN|nr:hypothetical protein IFM89_027896 [Coptis chinensis]